MSKDTNLQRFLNAQQSHYSMALSEIKNGKKRSHWMWYIFPQIQGLGLSEISRFYAIKNIHEAEEYLKHPVLGSRLIEISNQLLILENNDSHKVFDSPDDLKLCSSMTLFSSVPNTDSVFQKILDKFFKGVRDNKTLALIKK